MKPVTEPEGLLAAAPMSQSVGYNKVQYRTVEYQCSVIIRYLYCSALYCTSVTIRTQRQAILCHTVHMYTAHFMMNSANCLMYTAHCTLHNVLCILYGAHFILHTAHCSLHTAHYTNAHFILHCSVVCICKSYDLHKTNCQ